jgi:hypothetical protein
MLIEIFVIGVGTLAWLIPVGLLLLGIEMQQTPSSPVALALTAVAAYVAGLAADRASDAIFQPLDGRLRARWFSNRAEYVKAYNQALTTEGWHDQIAYSRHRVRISRAYCLNSVAGVAVTLAWGIWSDFGGASDVRVTAVLAVGCLALSGIMYLTWYRVRRGMYIQLSEKA